MDSPVRLELQAGQSLSKRCRSLFSPLKQISCGTEVTIEQEGIPDAIPPEVCYLGWQESLVLLGKLVEVEIPD